MAAPTADTCGPDAEMTPADEEQDLLADVLGGEQTRDFLRKTRCSGEDKPRPTATDSEAGARVGAGRDAR